MKPIAVIGVCLIAGSALAGWSGDWTNGGRASVRMVQDLVEAAHERRLALTTNVCPLDYTNARVVYQYSTSGVVAVTNWLTNSVGSNLVPASALTFVDQTVAAGVGRFLDSGFGHTNGDYSATNTGLVGSFPWYPPFGVSPFNGLLISTQTIKGHYGLGPTSAVVEIWTVQPGVSGECVMAYGFATNLTNATHNWGRGQVMGRNKNYTGTMYKIAYLVKGTNTNAVVVSATVATSWGWGYGTNYSRTISLTSGTTNEIGPYTNTTLLANLLTVTGTPANVGDAVVVFLPDHSQEWAGSWTGWPGFVTTNALWERRTVLSAMNDMAYQGCDWAYGRYATVPYHISSNDSSKTYWHHNDGPTKADVTNGIYASLSGIITNWGSYYLGGNKTFWRDYTDSWSGSMYSNTPVLFGPIWSYATNETPTGLNHKVDIYLYAPSETWTGTSEFDDGGLGLNTNQFTRYLTGSDWDEYDPFFMPEPDWPSDPPLPSWWGEGPNSTTRGAYIFWHGVIRWQFEYGASE